MNYDVLYLLSVVIFMVFLLHAAHVIYFRITGKTILKDDERSEMYKRHSRYASVTGITIAGIIGLLSVIMAISTGINIYKSQSTESALGVLVGGTLVSAVCLIVSACISYRILKKS